MKEINMEQLRKQLEWSKKQTKFAWKKFYQQKEKNDEKMKEMEKIIKELKVKSINTDKTIFFIV